jgi:predicted Zn-dependent protease
MLQSYGAMLCNSGRSAKAIEIFEVLLATTPDWNMARPCLYRALMSVGRTAEAQQVKEDYAKYSPDHSTW